MSIDPYWKDAESYSALEIAYLACGEEPKNLNQSQQEAPQKVINCFKAVWKFCVDEGFATKSEKFSSRHFDKQQAIELIDYFGTPGMPNFLKASDTQSKNDSIKPPAYLDESHPAYSEELRIAIQAWQAVLEHDPAKPRRGSRKQLLASWINQHHSKLTEAAKERIVTLLNPDKNGGAPRSE